MKIYVHSEPLHNWDSKFTQNCPKKKITPGNNADVLKQVSGQTKQKGDTAYHAMKYYSAMKKGMNYWYIHNVDKSPENYTELKKSISKRLHTIGLHVYNIIYMLYK